MTTADNTLTAAIERVRLVTLNVRDMRAERWLREWPEGHPERPKVPPVFVREYLEEMRAMAQRRT